MTERKRMNRRGAEGAEKEVKSETSLLREHAETAVCRGVGGVGEGG